MAKLTLSDVSNLLGNPTSAQNTINNNSNLIEQALENTLSRDGTTPNHMGADLDMNNNDILNVDTLDTKNLILDGFKFNGIDPEDLEAIRDVAEAIENGTLSNVVSQGNVPIYATVVGMSSLEVPAGITAVRVNGYYAVGDGGGALYVKVDDEPVHGGKFQTADGAWWVIAETNIDPRQFGAKGDGIADDSNAFDAMDAAVKDHVVDLKGETFLVSSIPTGKYRDGFFKVPDFEGQLAALIPAKSTIDTALTCLAAGPYYAAWPQDKWHMWDGVIYAFWMESSQHSTTDTRKYVVCMRSKDGGATWTQKERLFRDLYSGAGSSSFAAWVVDGVQFIEVRNDTTNEHRLFARRLAQRYELTNCIDTTAGSSQFDIDFVDAGVVIGAVEGMVANFDSVGTVGGLAINGDYTVSFVNGDRIQFTHGSNATSTVVNAGGTGADGYFGMVFSETGWQELLFDAGTRTLSQAILNVWGSGTEVNLHSASGRSSDAGTGYIGVSGGTVNAGIAKLNRMFDANGSIGGQVVSWVRQIPGDNALSEPSVAFDASTGSLYGFCRTQTSSVAPVFWWSDNEMQNVNVTSFGTGYAVQSPIPLVIVGDMIYGFASASRIGTTSGSGHAKAAVALYLLRASKTEARAIGADAFEWIVIDEAYFENHYHAVSNAVGVGSLIALDDTTLIAGYSSEVAPSNPRLGPTSVYALKIDLGVMPKRGRSRIAPGQVVTLSDCFYFFSGQPAVANGGYMRWPNLMIESAPQAYVPGTGEFVPPETAVYEFSLQIIYEDGTAGEKYIQLVDMDDNDLLRPGGMFLAVASNIGTPSNECQGFAHFPVVLRQGQRCRFKVTAANGTRSTTARGYLYIKKLS